jgi:hypothetical protein
LLEPMFMKLGMYIMTPEPISTAYFITPSHQSVLSVCVPPPIAARQRLGKHVRAETNTRNNRTAERFAFYTVRVVLKKSLWVCMCIPLSLLGNDSANTSLRQRRTIGDVVFCIVRVVSKESLWVCLCIPLSLLGNGSANTFLRQRKTIGGVVFCMVRVVSKESVGLSVYPSILVRQRLGKHVPATKKNYWRCRFLRGQCRIKGMQEISSSQNFLHNYKVLRQRPLWKWMAFPI